MRIILAFAIVVFVGVFLISNNVNAIQAQTSATSEPTKQFSINKEFWAFAGTYVIGSFNATAGDYLVLDISSVNIDPDRPDDRYSVEIVINSTSHGLSYVSGSQFRQTVSLNYTDSYTIYAQKFPFSSSVRVSGAVTVVHNSSAVGPAISVTPNPTSLPPKASPTPEVPEIPFLVLAVFTIAIISLSITAKIDCKRLIAR